MTKASILIVDDEPDVLGFMQELLERKGYLVRTATGGAQALVVLAENAPDLLITDLRMPVMDGLELLARVREQNPNLPSIVLTAAGDAPSAVRAMQAGAADYLIKPIDVRALLLAVERTLEHRALHSAPRGLHDLPVPGASLAEIEKYAITKTLAAVGGSTSRAAEILDVSVRKIQYRLHDYDDSTNGKTPTGD